MLRWDVFATLWDSSRGSPTHELAEEVQDKDNWAWTNSKRFFYLNRTYCLTVKQINSVGSKIEKILIWYWHFENLTRQIGLSIELGWIPIQLQINFTRKYITGMPGTSDDEALTLQRWSNIRSVGGSRRSSSQRLHICFEFCRFIVLWWSEWGLKELSINLLRYSFCLRKGHGNFFCKKFPEPVINKNYVSFYDELENKSKTCQIVGQSLNYSWICLSVQELI